MNPNGTLLLTQSDVARLLNMDECIDAMERVFKRYGEGNAPPPGILGIQARDGGFHIKAALLDKGKTYFAAKINANFPLNPERFGLPTIQGVIVLSDGENGYPLAVMDSIEVTTRRTSAATAVAAKYLARKRSSVLTICGCGNQGGSHLESLPRGFPLRRVYLFDSDLKKAAALARSFADRLPVEVITLEKLAASLKESDICVTCTPSRRFFLKQDDVARGAFIAGVGADNEHKQELDPRLLSSNKVVVDILGQSAAIGDLHHTLEEGLMKRSDVYAELGEIVAGRKPGRESSDEIIIFDSTGMALQDAAAAILVYRKAIDHNIGTMIQFSTTPIH